MARLIDVAPDDVFRRAECERRRQGHWRNAVIGFLALLVLASIVALLTTLSPQNATWKNDAAFFDARIAELAK